LKGITVYRDKCRTGVLVDINEKKKGEFTYHDAPKRPQILDAHYYFIKYKNNKYAVVVGLLEDKPYEVFAFDNPVLESNVQGSITKISKGCYQFDSLRYTVENLQLSASHSEEMMLTRMASLLLRHGANPEFIAQQVEKAGVKVTSFGKVISRILMKYVPDGEVHGEECPECHSKTIIRQEGCKKCTTCAYSRC
jgi:ribonucleoside-diphosphate reductase alpha chain